MSTPRAALAPLLAAGRQGIQIRSALLTVLAGTLAACQPTYDTPRTSLRLRGAPPDAIVIVDDQPIAPLRVVEKRGLSLTRGRHHITVEREGYFPFDRAIDADDSPVQLDVQLTRLPD